MSKKKIFALFIITIIAIAGVVGYISFSFTDSTVAVGPSIIIDNITQEGPTSFGGNVQLQQEIYIYNSGQLDLEDIVADITVFFSGNINSTEVEVGQGTNELGIIEAGANESRTLTITLSNQIVRLAVEDGTLRILVEVTLNVQFIPYSFDLPQQESTEPWDAPFGVV